MAEAGDRFRAALAAMPTDPTKRAAAKWRAVEAMTASDRLGALDVRIGVRIVARYMNAAGEAWPSGETLAKDSGCTRRAVINSISRLVEAGFLAVKPGRGRATGGDGRANRYTIEWTRFPADNVNDGSHYQSNENQDSHLTSQNVNGEAFKCENGRTPNVNVGSHEPFKRTLPKNPEEERSPRATRAAAPAHERGADDEIVAEMVAIYSEVLAEVLPQPREITPKRRSAALARFRDSCGSDLEAWREACLQVGASSFLTGSGPRGWRADFDWLTNKNNLLKLAEGKYRDRPNDRRSGRPPSLLDAVDEVFERLERHQSQNWKGSDRV